MMTIAFDGKRAVNNMTGLGNYSRNLIHALSQYHPEHQYVLLAPKMRHHQAIDDLLQLKNVSVVTPKMGTFGHIWRSGRGIIRSAQRVHAQIYHGLSAELPMGIANSGMKSVVTIHDLIYHHYPQYHSAIDRWIYDRKMLHAVRIADRIITVSQCTKDDVVNAFGVAPEKIQVIYPSIDRLYYRLVDSADISRLRQLTQLPEQFILAVGRLVGHKNLMLPIKSLAMLDDKSVNLVIVGNPNSYWRDTLYPAIVRRHLTDRVQLIPWVSPEWMPALYATARAVVFPSLYEGFGLPVLEAQQCGTPVLCADTSSLPEAGGDAACFFNAHDAEELARLIDRVLADSEYAQALRAKGLEHAAQFAPQIMARRIVEVYRDCLNLPQIT